MAVQEVSVAELYEAHINQGGAVLIDVRTHAEFEGQHIPGSKCIPLDQLSREIVAEHQKHPDEPIYIICRSGNRSAMAVRKLMESDFQKALSVSGGILAWQESGYPVKVGERKVIALDRQVRITAGALAALGTLLGLFVNPWFLIIPLGVGCGLTFSGITDTCAMGAILAKMPWNKGSSGDCKCG
jgi:rhodanese-related sulfurtransferase